MIEYVLSIINQIITGHWLQPMCHKFVGKITSKSRYGALVLEQKVVMIAMYRGSE